MSLKLQKCELISGSSIGAQAMLASLDSAYYQVGVMARIDAAHARRGDRNQARADLATALERAKTKNSGGSRTGGYEKILQAQIEMPDFDSAIETASFLNRWDRSGKLADVAVALARNKKSEKACRIAEGLPQDGGENLARIGLALVETGQRNAMKRLLVHAAQNFGTAEGFCKILAPTYPEQIPKVALAISARQSPMPAGVVVPSVDED